MSEFVKRNITTLKRKLYRREVRAIRLIAQVLPNKISGTIVFLSRKNAKTVLRLKNCLEAVAKILNTVE